METLQRIVSRQWTDLSQKRTSKRLKPFDEPFIFTEEENDNYCQNETKANTERQNLAFSSPLHFYNSSNSEAITYSNSLKQPSHCMNPSMSAKDIKEFEVANYQLETGHLHGLRSITKSNEKFSHFQQPLQKCVVLYLLFPMGCQMIRFCWKKLRKKMLRATNQIRDKFQSSTNTGSASSTNTFSSAQISPKSKTSSQKSDLGEDMDEDKPKKQTRIMEVRNKLSNGRKKKSDNQNLLMFEELND